jgi:hypothetical protein
MTAQVSRVRRVMGQPVFLVLAGVFMTLAVCCGVPFTLSQTVFSCEHSGFGYPNPLSTAGRRHYVARVVSIDCGAVSDFDARVVITTPGNGLRDDRETVFISGLDPRMITLKWESDFRLVIEYPDSPYARIVKALPTWRDVTIVYRIKN